MVDPAPLCEFCQRVELDVKKLCQIRLRKWCLGSENRIMASSCPLCSIIRRVWYEDYRKGSEDVYLTWLNDNSSIRSRGAFRVNGTKLGEWLCFEGKPDYSDELTNEQGPFFITSVPSQIDIRKILSWIQGCTAGHDECRLDQSSPFKTTFPGLQVLRLIDVDQMRIVELQEWVEYVCLSYVWGAASSIRLTKSNRSALMERDSLRVVQPAMLARTIRDTITLVKKLKIRYLWVDALCLVQNDPDDVRRGVTVMDRIYERSYFTVVAADGHDANYGLPGVEVCTRTDAPPAFKVLPGVSLRIWVQLELLLRSSIYETRGWTFQERLLTTRAIVFIDGQLYFRCRRGDQAERAYGTAQDFSHPRVAENNISRLFDRKLQAHRLDLENLITLYSRRQLTNELDTLNAFAGILRRYSDTRDTPSIFQGMPLEYFHDFLSFQAERGLLRRRPSFPSYAWSGWIGGVQFPFWRTRSWVTFYQKVGQLSAMKLETEVSSLDADMILCKVDPLSENRERFCSLPTPAMGLGENLGSIPYPLLQFWTFSLFFELHNVDLFGGYGKLVGVDGQIHASVELNGVEDYDIFQEGRLFEFITFSTTENENSIGQIRLTMIHWEGSVAERRGIAHISHSRAFNNSFPPGPMWKEILLG
ncbi:HET-domain-containing protein [Thozetella sp. PMI_491]|nr:HET-domain-containing protein [Thozetella sp. PMI_491]